MFRKKILSFFSPRRIVEIIGIALFLGVVVYVAQAISPYQQPVHTEFYQADKNEAGAVTLHRAKIISMNANTEKMTVQLLDAPPNSQAIEIEAQSAFFTQGGNPPSAGQTVVVSISEGFSGYIDRWRLPWVMLFAAIFVVVVWLVGRRRGLASVLGLVVTGIILFAGVIPAILAGVSAFLACCLGALVIAIITVFLAHGIRKRTVISVGIMVGILTLMMALSYAIVRLTFLSGMSGEDERYFAQANPMIDMTGILAGGIVFATLGVLDDIVTAQVAVVEELKKANKKLSMRTLYHAAQSVGREHIASLVNTMVLAYAGVALPQLIAIVGQDPGNMTLLLNSEFITQEIIRALVSSFALVLAVPAASLCAAYVFTRQPKKRNPAP